MPQHAIAARRLVNQRIAGEQCTTPEAVVRWMGAIQAQDYNQALWAIGVRMSSATAAAVEAAIADGRILRTWPMRGTIHFVPAEDARWMLELCATRVLSGHRRRMQQLELTEAIIARSQAVLVEALTGGQRLTRADLLQRLDDAGISTEGQRGYHLLWRAAHAGVICLGPMQGRQQTFALLDEWAPPPRERTADEALAELLTRFFASHGPATDADFARWAGLTLTETRQGLQMVPDRLTSEEIDGVTYWMARGTAPSAPDEPDAGVHLLPGFDEYVIGYKDRSAVLAAEHAQKIVPGNNGVFQPIIVAAGQVIGTWKRKVRRRSIAVTLHPFTPLNAAQAAGAQAAAEAYGAFLGLPVTSVEVASTDHHGP